MIVTGVVAASIVLQVLAGILALRLVRETGAKLAWTLVTAGVWGMAMRRVVSLAWLSSADSMPPIELPFELLGLVTSSCMLLGVYGIGPLFEQSRRAREEAERHSRDVETLNASLQAVLDNARVLRGLLPICASCKKIRDDQGYWHHLEAYIQANSEADFSHGICPDCAERLYPELSRRKGRKSPQDAAGDPSCPSEVPGES